MSLQIDPGGASALVQPVGTHGESLWRTAFRRLIRSPMAIIGAVIVAFFVLVAIFAPLLAPHEPESAEWIKWATPSYVMQSGPGHPLGIDRYGSDMLTQLIYGARQTLVIGIVATGLGLTVGSMLGVLAGASATLLGRVGGWIDVAVMRIVDIMLSVPSLLLAISVAAIIGQTSTALMIAIGTVQVPVFARLLRGSMLSQGKTDYVLAAGALGLRKRTIVMSHLLPNSIGPTIVQATLNLATAVIEVAALSYLGLGSGNIRAAEWGRMIVGAQDWFEQAPWLAFYPGVCIVLFALGFSLLGESLREALDPKQRR